MLSTVFLICSIRTNAIFVLTFLAAALGFMLATAAFWSLAEGSLVTGGMLVKGAGGCFFAAAMSGWYLFMAIMLGSVDMPFGLPVFDLSSVVKGASEKVKSRAAQE